MAMSDSNDDSKTVSFSVSLGTDREGFLRRECVSCGREFKTEVDSSELTWALAAQCEHAGLQVDMTASDDEPPSVLRCPFCGHEAPGTDMHTRETVDYMKRSLEVPLGAGLIAFGLLTESWMKASRQPAAILGVAHRLQGNGQYGSGRMRVGRGRK
jgi:hypothetical protein